MATLTRRNIVLAGLALTALGITGCSDADPGTVLKGGAARRQPGTPQEVAATELTSFSVRLMSQTFTPDKNLVASPLSVAIALSLTRNGAQGDTATQMDRVLGAADLGSWNQSMNTTMATLASRTGEYPAGDDKVRVIVELANAIWSDKSIVPEAAFLDALAEYYGAGVATADFKNDLNRAVKAINGWAKKNTHDLIPEILKREALPEDPRMVLVNTVYLKAAWLIPFSKGGTSIQPFTKGDGSQARVPTMQAGTGSWFEDATCQATSIPYAGNKLAMAVALPKSTPQRLLTSWAQGGLSNLLNKMTGETVQLSMPRWSFNSDQALKDALTQLGMPLAFSDLADFSAMTRSEGLKIGQVFHGAKISVNEAGTEAAAATAVVMLPISGAANPRALRLDRPFCFAIYDIELKVPLFLGVVVDPSAN